LKSETYNNPFRPAAGHNPPYLAGRDGEIGDYNSLLNQDVVHTNLILTGLRGVGKTVLLDNFRRVSIRHNWLWAGTDFSESSSISEEKLATRLLTDLSVVTSGTVIATQQMPVFGFNREIKKVDYQLSYALLEELYTQTPGLVSDKIKAVFEFVWECLKSQPLSGIVFAYDEAQVMSDHARKEEYPLSLLLDVFQSIQRKQIPFLLILTGLPTLYGKLLEARTYSERMFRVMFLDRLSKEASFKAIDEPLKECDHFLHPDFIHGIVEESGGYPYFLQFIGREYFDIVLQVRGGKEIDPSTFQVHEIVRKLDNDFFSGRWAKATDRQQELLKVIAGIPNVEEEFTIQEIVEASKEITKPFSSSNVTQMLRVLGDKGLIYRNRHGKYSFSIPMLGQYILRQHKD